MCGEMVDYEHGAPVLNALRQGIVRALIHDLSIEWVSRLGIAGPWFKTYFKIEWVSCLGIVRALVHSLYADL